MSTGRRPRRAPASRSGVGAVLAGFVVLALVAGPSWTADRQLRRFLSALDEQLLGQASASLEQLLARQREQLVAEVKVLADDNRIRATVLAPKFDEATVQDILEDCGSRRARRCWRSSTRREGHAVAGRGRAARGEPGRLRPPSSPGSTTRRRTSGRCPDQVQVVGVAPIRSGDQTPALLVKGCRWDDAARDGRGRRWA
jgi:hypothetical protein